MDLISYKDFADSIAPAGRGHIINSLYQVDDFYQSEKSTSIRFYLSLKDQRIYLEDLFSKIQDYEKSADSRRSYESLDAIKIIVSKLKEANLANIFDVISIIEPNVSLLPSLSEGNPSIKIFSTAIINIIIA